LSLGTLDQTVC